jgi:hypothetical protein
MNIMTRYDALEILRQDCAFLEHHFPNHPANAKFARERIYALRIAILTLEEWKNNAGFETETLVKAEVQAKINPEISEI